MNPSADTRRALRATIDTALADGEWHTADDVRGDSGATVSEVRGILHLKCMDGTVVKECVKRHRSSTTCYRLADGTPTRTALEHVRSLSGERDMRNRADWQAMNNRARAGPETPSPPKEDMSDMSENMSDMSENMSEASGMSDAGEVRE